MSDEVHLDTEEMRKLGAAFALHAYDLGRHLSDFKRRTDADVLRDGYGTASPASYAELTEAAELVAHVIGRLRDRLDEIGCGMRTGAMNSEAAEANIAELIREVR